MAHARRVLLLALATAAPGLLAATILLFGTPHPPRTRWTVAILVGLGTWILAWTVREAVVRPLGTLSNLLGALREEDFSFRARTDRSDDDLNLAFAEANALADTLREQRLRALEATALVRNVLEEIEVAVFAVDDGGRLRLVNRAGERLLGQPVERLLGASAEEMGLAPALSARTPAVLDLTFPSGSARWEVRHGAVRQGGVPLRLLVLSDVGRALREEERQAWQRLIRVLGHELNNSLAPIRSVADSLADLLAHEPRPHDWEDDVQRGLTVIAARAASLSRFMDAYARLARLPPPKRDDVDLPALVARAARLETRVPVVVEGGPRTPLAVDPDQLEQLLINLLKNAAEAAAETGGGVRVGWTAPDGYVELWVEDDGPGLPQSANLFVPFFTTKPAGSGIGLVLSRQIAEGHGGSLVLENRREGHGCRARVRLPR